MNTMLTAATYTFESVRSVRRGSLVRSELKGIDPRIPSEYLTRKRSDQPGRYPHSRVEPK